MQRMHAQQLTQLRTELEHDKAFLLAQINDAHAHQPQQGMALHHHMTSSSTHSSGCGTAAAGAPVLQGCQSRHEEKAAVTQAVRAKAHQRRNRHCSSAAAQQHRHHASVDIRTRASCCYCNRVASRIHTAHRSMARSHKQLTVPGVDYRDEQAPFRYGRCRSRERSITGARGGARESGSRR